MCRTTFHIKHDDNDQSILATEVATLEVKDNGLLCREPLGQVTFLKNTTIVAVDLLQGQITVKPSSP